MGSTLVPVKDEVHVREGEITRLEDQILMRQGAEDYFQTVNDVVVYDAGEYGGPIPDPVLSNYPTLVEKSMKHVNVHHVDIDVLKDGPYHPNMIGFDIYHQVMAKDQEWGC